MYSAVCPEINDALNAVFNVDGHIKELAESIKYYDEHISTIDINKEEFRL
jgi:hypothetical protein